MAAGSGRQFNQLFGGLSVELKGGLAMAKPTLPFALLLGGASASCDFKSRDVSPKVSDFNVKPTDGCAKIRTFQCTSS